jgi:hypothetical protein
LQAHADAFHVAMSRGKRLGPTENEISPRNACITHAPSQDGNVKAAAAQ